MLKAPPRLKRASLWTRCSCPRFPLQVQGVFVRLFSRVFDAYVLLFAVLYRNLKHGRDGVAAKRVPNPAGQRPARFGTRVKQG